MVRASPQRDETSTFSFSFGFSLQLKITRLQDCKIARLLAFAIRSEGQPWKLGNPNPLFPSQPPDHHCILPDSAQTDDTIYYQYPIIISLLLSSFSCTFSFFSFSQQPFLARDVRPGRPQLGSLKLISAAPPTTNTITQAESEHPQGLRFPTREGRHDAARDRRLA